LIRYIFVFIFIYTYNTLAARTITGKVIDVQTGESVPFAKISIIFQDKMAQVYSSNLDGDFSFQNDKTIIMLITICAGYFPDTVYSSQFKNNKRKVLLEPKNEGIICYEKIEYKAEEYNEKYDVKVEGLSTTNFIDSLGLKQGRWIITQNDKYDRRSKFSYGQPMSIGYYKNNVKVGKWLILRPSGKIKKIINY
jgi:antitoxin component YwqK of YwqJK toxin-antitoxin module